jgi:hypothetical protein
MRPLLACLLILVFGSCYEDVVGCLDPDATNYNLGADLACPDCCTYPTLSLRVSPLWGNDAVVAGNRYPYGTAGDSFTLVRFRYYLGELRLEGQGTELPDPARPVELATLINGDTVTTALNGNYLLGTTAVTTTRIGTIRTGTTALVALTGTYGLPDRYRAVIPFLAPSGDALRTQPGLLNFNDGRGYVQSRLEYALEPGGDTLSVASYGSLPFELDFGGAILPDRGVNAQINLVARLDELIGGIDLSGEPELIGDQLGESAGFLRFDDR